MEEGLPDLYICIEDQTLTCGWLLGEVTKRYSLLVQQYSIDRRKRALNREELGVKISKKIIAAIKSQN